MDKQDNTREHSNETRRGLPGTPQDWISWMDLLSTYEQDRIAIATGFLSNGQFDMSKETDFDKACNQARIVKLQ